MGQGVGEVLAALLSGLKSREVVINAPPCNVIVVPVDAPLGLLKRRVALHFDGRCYRILVLEAGLRGLRDIRGLKLCPE